MLIKPDRAEIARVVTALFPHADKDTFVSLRAFRDHAEGNWGYERWPTVRIGGNLGAEVEAARRFSFD